MHGLPGPAFNAWDLAATTATHDSSLVEDIRYAQAFAQESRATSTIARYATHWDGWCKWCAKHQLQALPAKPVHVAAYLGKLLRWCVESKRSFSAIKMASAAIFSAHQLAGLDATVTSHPMVASVRSAAARILGLAPKNPKQPIPKELCIKAAKWCVEQRDFLTASFMLICFSAFLRYSDAVRIPAFGVKFVDAGVELFIPKRKTDQYRRGTHIRVNAASAGSPICPVSILKCYFRTHPVRSDDITIPLFRKNKKSVDPWPYPDARESVLAALVASSGLSLDIIRTIFGTHSLRKGGATAAGNKLKADDQTVADFLARGGWRSKQVAALYTKPSCPVARAVGF